MESLIALTSNGHYFHCVNVFLARIAVYIVTVLYFPQIRCTTRLIVPLLKVKKESGSDEGRDFGGRIRKSSGGRD